MTVLARFRVVASPEKRDDLIRTLRSLVGPTEVDPSCLQCDIYQGSTDQNIVYYLEEWKTREDLLRQIRSARFQRLMAVIDQSIEPPEVRFDTITKTEGMEAIVEARGITQ